MASVSRADLDPADFGYPQIMLKGVFLGVGPEGFGAYRVDGDDWTPTIEQPEGVLSPGLVDLHIHGAFGVDFMSATAEQILSLCELLAQEGYEAFLPTTVTASPAAVRRALESLPDGHPMVPGFHLEGPFLSPEYPGAQPPDAIVDAPDGESEWDAILSDQRLRIITMAPERPNALAWIKKLSSRGVIVSFGHTDATFEQASAGFDAGGRHATHTFNAMRPLHHREAGMVGFILHEDAVRAELIYDRVHVSPAAAAILVRLKMPNQLLAVSDSTIATGLHEGQELQMWGLDCVVGQTQVRLKSNGALAGSAITLKHAFKNLAEDFGPEVAIRAACHNPRLALGMPGKPKVMCVWNKNWDLVERIDIS